MRVAAPSNTVTIYTRICGRSTKQAASRSWCRMCRKARPGMRFATVCGVPRRASAKATIPALWQFCRKPITYGTYSHTGSGPNGPRPDFFGASPLLMNTKSSARRTRFIDPFQPAEVRRLVKEFGSPLLILDCERGRGPYRKLRTALPGVDLHYALKPMPHPSVVNTIVAEGGFLDLATTGEVHLVERLGVAPERCIHTHPIKRE